jgi:lipopolysaccharide export system protein LptA
MPKKFEYRAWDRALRKTVFFLLIFCLAAVILSIVFSSGKRARKTESIVSAESQAVSFQEKFQAVEFSGQKRKISLRAEKFYIDQAGNQNLEGQVEMVDEELPERIVLKAEKVVIDKEKRKLQAEGGVEVKSINLLIQAPGLEYNFDHKKFFCSSEAKLVRENLSLNSKKLSYSVENQTGIFEDGVEARSTKPGSEFKLSTPKLTLEGKKSLILADDLKLGTERFEAEAVRSAILLYESKGDFKRVELEGKAVIVWHGQALKSEFTHLKLGSERLSLERGRSLIVLSTDDPFEIQGKGEVWQMEGSGQNLEIDFFEGQKSEIFRAEKVNLKLLRSTGDEFSLSGQKLEQRLDSGQVIISGAARGSFKEYEVKAARISFQLADQSLEAVEPAILVRSGFLERQTVLFRKGQPVFITGFLARIRPEVLEVTGKARIWQAEVYFLGERARLEKETGIIYLEGQSRVSLSREDSAGEIERINLSADGAICSPDKKQLMLSGSIVFQKERLRLLADEIRMFFEDRAPEKLSSLEASGHVSVFWKEYQAKSQQAIFKLTENIIIMNGLPELSNLQGDRLEADKLTLYLSDDRIQVENQKRERSLTILVRGK